MDEDSTRYWIIPILALIIGFVMFGFMMETKINDVLPNAAIEFDEIQSMTCPEIKERNSMGSYWTPENGKYARDKVKTCIDAEDTHKAQLKNIRQTGTHQDKIDAGFTKLWFGVYDHPDLSFSQVPGEIKIVHGSNHGFSNFIPNDTTVIIGYNNTIKFPNEADMVFMIQENHGLFMSKLIEPNQTASITINDPGEYEYFAKPWMTGKITVVEP